MVCIYCSDETHVINSRPQKRLNQTWRRRKCLNCGAIFSTQEGADYSAAWTVGAVADGINPFNRDKLFLSLHNSLQHRPTALSDASALTDTVIQKLRGEVRNGSIRAHTITQVVQVALNRFDKVASVHYQAFHNA